MKRASLPLLARHVGLCLLLTSGIALGEADEFYLNRLQSGQEAYRQRRTAEAADELRVACFGLLDAPPVLMECLAWLANAQEAAGRTEEAGATLARVLEVEGKFRVFAKTRLEPSIRAELEKLLVKRMSREALIAVPEFARLTVPAPAKDGRGARTATPSPKK